jgi:hypothetical protein
MNLTAISGYAPPTCHTEIEHTTTTYAISQMATMII